MMQLSERLDQWSDGLDALETFAATLVAKTAPFLMPAPTAVLASGALQRHLAWPQALAVIVAVALESFGLAVMSAWIQIYQAHRAGDARAPLGVISVLAAVYFVCSVSLVVLLDTFPAYARYAPVMLPLLSVSSMTVLGLRADQRRRARRLVPVQPVQETRETRRDTDGTRRDTRETRRDTRETRRDTSPVVQDTGATLQDTAETSETRHNTGETVRDTDDTRRDTRETVRDTDDTAYTPSLKEEALVQFYMNHPGASLDTASSEVQMSKSWTGRAVNRLIAAHYLARDEDGVRTNGRVVSPVS